MHAWQEESVLIGSKVKNGKMVGTVRNVVLEHAYDSGGLWRMKDMTDWSVDAVCVVRAKTHAAFVATVKGDYITG
jgi:hypothetical protein